MQPDMWNLGEGDYNLNRVAISDFIEGRTLKQRLERCVE